MVCRNGEALHRNDAAPQLSNAFHNSPYRESGLRRRTSRRSPRAHSTLRTRSTCHSAVTLSIWVTDGAPISWVVVGKRSPSQPGALGLIGPFSYIWLPLDFSTGSPTLVKADVWSVNLSSGQ
jgi:hypothetical protein